MLSVIGVIVALAFDLMRYPIFLLLVLSTIQSAQSVVLQELCHTLDIQVLRSWSHYLASQDENLQWRLYDVETKQPIWKGRVQKPAANLEFAGGTLVIPQNDGFAIYKVPDPDPVKAETDPCSQVEVTDDGKWIGCGTPTELSIWDRDGKKVITAEGDFSNARIASDSTLLFAASVGSDLMPIYNLSQGAISRVLKFEGAFQTWLDPGKRFMTLDSNKVKTFSIQTGILSSQAVPGIQNLGGFGNFFWHTVQDTAIQGSLAPQLHLYKIGVDTRPHFSLNLPSFTSLRSRNNVIAAFAPSMDSLLTLAFEGDSVSVNLHQVGRRGVSFNGGGSHLGNEFEGIPTKEFFVGGGDGVIQMFRPAQDTAFLSHGRVVSMVGTQTGFLAASMSSGMMQLFKQTDTGFQKVDSFAHPTAIHMAMSDDGQYLVTQTELDKERSPESPAGHFFVTASHIPTQRMLAKWKEPFSNWNLDLMGLARRGNVMSRVASQSKVYLYSLSQDSSKNLDSLPARKMTSPTLRTSWSYAWVSPNGGLCATSDETQTFIYRGSQLLRTFSGSFGGWFDTTQFIVNNSKQILAITTLGKIPGTGMMDTSGRVDSTFKFWNPVSLQSPISHSEIWVSGNGASGIFNIRSGEQLLTTEEFTKAMSAHRVSQLGADWVAIANDTAIHAVNWREWAHVPQAILPQRQSQATSFQIQGKQVSISFFLSGEESLELMNYSLSGQRRYTLPLGVFNKGQHRLIISTPILGPMDNANGPTLFLLKSKKEILGTQLVLRPGLH
jgi:hypothetical protein